MPQLNDSGSFHRGVNMDPRFTGLFNQYYPRLCLYAFQILHNRQDAEDIVQDCFVKLWMRRQEVNYEHAIASYLYTMVRNRCYNFVRDSRVRRIEQQSLAELTSDDGFDQVVIAETHSRLYDLLQTLPEKCKEIFLMLMEGRSHGNIAADLNISESTVRTQKARALTILRKALRAVSLYKFLFTYL